MPQTFEAALGLVFLGLGIGIVQFTDQRAFGRPAADRLALAGAAGFTLLWLGSGIATGAWIAGAMVTAAAFAAMSILRSDVCVGQIADNSSFVIAAAGLGSAYTGLTAISLIDAALGIVISAGLLALAAWTVRLRRSAPGLGGGDIILAGACGAWSGALATGPALLIAALATIGGALLVRRQKDARIPFAPGLLGGYGLVTLYEALR